MCTPAVKQAVDDGVDSLGDAGRDLIDASGDTLAGLDDARRGDTEGAGEKFGDAFDKGRRAITPDIIDEFIDDAGDAFAGLDDVVNDRGGPNLGGGGGSNVDIAEEEELTIPDAAKTPTVTDAQRGKDVDASKRRRGRAGFLGTILTGNSGLTGSGNIGRTILGS